MRIGIDATSLPPRPGGAGNYIIQLIRSLAKLENFRSGKDTLIIFAQARGQAMINLPELEWVSLPDRSPFQRMIWEQLQLPGLVRSYHLDLLHSLHYTRPIYLSCPSVVTFHDMTFFLFPNLHLRSKRLFFPAMIRFSARYADALIAPSESTRKDAIRLVKIPPKKIHTIHLGVSDQFRPVTDAVLLDSIHEKYKLPPKFILYVGTVEPRKNLTMLLQSYNLIRSEDSTFPLPLVVVGQLGWNYDEVFNQVKQLDLQEQVIFTGYIPFSDLPIMYSLAEIFVYPSLYEGFGLPPLEAMACGTPVITTAISSMPEHIGDAGILVSPNDPGALALAIQQLAENEAKRNQLRIQGPQQAAQFTWERTAYLTNQLYQNLVAGVR